MNNGFLFTSQQVADIIHAGRRTVCKMIDEGVIPGHRLRGRNRDPGDRRVSRESLLAYMRAEGFPVPTWLLSDRRVLLIGRSTERLLPPFAHAGAVYAPSVAAVCAFDLSHADCAKTAS